ncbi:DUF58 domain-containing protein [Spirochaeta lutea]|uniref:DUF58 domain-containing protein n=1 Tax=Spirochaeta lutea TaxID=1480694 RepID=A0A098QZY5_9SPIO|nr:DUF58 domain-containing protein [Spirochaeta lutea]KGE73435.1 hypothetical protein DC28_04015 [Spirochaeta lutea]
MNAARLLARIKHLELVSNRLVETLLSGNYRSVFKGPGIEFSEVREYSEGDDPRLIDWNVSSRMNGVYTKTFREERELVLFLIADVSPSVLKASGAHNLREIMEVLFAIFTFAAVNNNDQVGGVFFSDRIEHWVPPMKGKRHAFRLIQDMIDFTPRGRGSNLSQALRTTSEALKRRGICIVISDFKTSGYQKDLSLLARRHDVIAIRLASPDEQEFPRVGLVTLQDAETGKTITASGKNHHFRRAYHEHWQNQRQAWFRECRRQGVSPLEVSAGDDPVIKLFQFFQRRRGRA